MFTVLLPLLCAKSQAWAYIPVKKFSTAYNTGMKLLIKAKLKFKINTNNININV